MVRLQFCSPEFMRKGQVTPCAAIVDSGNTLISGPPEHVATLLGSICDSWPRCAKNHTAMVQAAEAVKAAATENHSSNPAIWSKEKTLSAILFDCEDWLNESVGTNDEMPDLHFHIIGGNGTKETLILPPYYYLSELDVEQEPGGRDVDFSVPSDTTGFGFSTGGHRKVCQHAFFPLEYATNRHGQAWILGTNFFYEFNVHYDLSSKPPSIAFQSVKQTPCGSCDKRLALASTGRRVVSGAASTAAGWLRRPRRLTGPARMPSFELGPVL
mmetsp:Transcript_71020/g.196114  ORF Transcript_71020/g.196114 Transcript_71020/m.196114 type:complete len:270 (+) Transcript_71020:839-1648(+)